MAKDDYSVVVLKILSYLYGCLKNGEDPSAEVLSPSGAWFQTKGKPLNESYWENILSMLQEDGLIKGIRYTKPWGAEKIRISDISEIRITTAGISYLQENGSMRKALEVLKSIGDVAAKAISAIVPFA